jgi:diguanylate cyclase (GGDEF)-like protein
VDSNTDRFAPLFPAAAAWQVGSLALVPIWMDGEVIGSLNFGDTDPHRYTPDLDPQLLRRLGVKVSVCLSNVTAHEKLSFLAFHDALTGLLNRRVMANVLAREVDRSRRYGHPLSVVFIDVDDFKAVNDTHGHECGDALLQHLAGILSGCCRVSDIVARFAGDEFVLILPEGDEQSARHLMDRICGRVGNEPLQTPSATVPYAISFGIAALKADAPETPEALLQRADQQLYRVKRSKKPQTDRHPGRVIAFPEPSDPSRKKKP